MKQQRKEIISQILDLQHSRKTVNVSDVNTQGVSFTDSPGARNDIITNTPINWDIISYTSDIGDSHPSLSLFNNIDLIPEQSISHTMQTCNNGLFLQDQVNYHANIKYKTRVVPKRNITDRLKFEGHCAVSVYVNNELVLSNTSTGPGQDIVSQSSGQITFQKDIQYTIAVVVYGHMGNVVNSSVSLSSDLFKYLHSSSVIDIPEPINLTASSNDPNNIFVGWEQLPSTNLVGGGVEIWAKQAYPEGLDYEFLSRVDYPQSTYTHTQQAYSQNMASNGNFQSYGEDTIFSDGDSFLIPDSAYTDTTALNGWELGTEAFSDCVYVVDSGAALGDFSSFLSLNLHGTNNFTCDRVVAYNVQGNGTQYNFVTGNYTSQTVLGYNNTYYVIADATTSGVALSPTGTVYVIWDVSEDIEDAEVDVDIYKGGSPDYHTVDAIDRTFVYELDVADMVAFLADPSHIQVRVETNTTNRNSASTSAYVGLIDVYIKGSGGEESSIVLKSSPVFYDPASSYYLDVITSKQPIPPGFDAFYNLVESDGYVHIPQAATEGRLIVSSDTWSRYRFSLEEAGSSVLSGLSGTLRAAIRWTKQEPDQDDSMNIQSVFIIKSSGRSIASDTEYDYIIRNYTSSLGYSDFVGPIRGTTAPVVYHLSLEPESPHASHFKKTKVYAQATVGLSDLDVYVEDNLGYTGNVVPLDLIYANENQADFTYEFTPIFHVPVIYDTFKTDFEVHPLTLGGTYLQDLPIYADYNSSEQSPHRATAENVTSGSAIYIRTAEGPLESPWAPAWVDDDFKRTFRIYTWRTGNYKEYNYSTLTDSYTNLPESYQEENLPSGVPNRKKVSIGFIGQFSNMSNRPGDSEYITLLDGGDKFKVLYNNIDETFEFYIITDEYPGAQIGNYRLRHRFTTAQYDTDWYYIHMSFDKDNWNDLEHSFVSIYNTTMDTSVASTGIYTGSTALTAQGTNLNWHTSNSPIRFGCISGTKNAVSMVFDSLYITAGAVKRTIIDENVFPLVSGGELGNQGVPYYPSFGYKTGVPLRIHGEGRMVSSVDIDVNQTSIPHDADLLVADTDLMVDWYDPSGDIYIVKDSFTLTQENIDDYVEASQPLYTYQKLNKVYASYTSPVADIEYIRFSNDRLTWGDYVPFSNQILYPWELEEIGADAADTSEGGIRHVYAQVLTSVMNSSDPWTDEGSVDDIYYNPLGSVGNIQSYNYEKGVVGWSIDLTGNAEFSNVLLRSGATNLGKDLGPLKLAESNVGTQFAKEYSKTVQSTTGELPFGEFDSGPFSFYTSPAYCYSSNVCATADYSNLFYIPAISITGGYPYRDNYIISYDIDTKELRWVYTGNGAYAPSIALSDEHAYISSGSYIKKYNKSSFINDFVAIAEYSSSESCHGVRAYYSETKEFRLMSLQEVEGIGSTASIKIFDENLALLQTLVFASSGEILDAVMDIDSFDVNGTSLSIAFGAGNIYHSTLRSDGLLADGQPVVSWGYFAAHPRSKTLDLETITDNYNGGRNAFANLPTTNNLFRYPTSVYLLGNSVVAYTKVGQNPISDTDYDTAGIESYHILCTIDFAELRDQSVWVPSSLHQGNDSGIRQLLYFGDKPMTQGSPGGYHARVYSARRPHYNQYLIGEWIGNGRALFDDVGATYGDKPPYVYDPTEYWMFNKERAIGFTRPVLSPQGLLINHVSSSVYDSQWDFFYRSTGKLLFKTTERSIEKLPSFLQGEHGKTVLSSFYNGMYMSEILLGEYQKIFYNISLL